ncbi:MAG: hypothetical protein GY696_26610, partial [Gammaproteobacteria bacterium]|nr:hypothetical protein [Gammaproteobacteria bacterium]
MLHQEATQQDAANGGKSGGNGRSRSKYYNNNHNMLMESSVDGGSSSASNLNIAYSTTGSVRSGYSGDNMSQFQNSGRVAKKDQSSLVGMAAGPGASGRFLALSSKQLLNRALNKFLNKPKHLGGSGGLDDVDEASMTGGSTCTSSAAAAAAHHMFPVNSLAAAHHGHHMNDRGGYENGTSSEDRSEFPEHVLKVYKSDQTCKYLLVHKETSAHEVVMLSLQEFGITNEPSTNYTLCEVTVAEGGFVKQRTLPDALKNLAERIGLASRYYIKNIQDSEALLPDEYTQDLQKESLVTMLQLNPVEVSTQLMVEDFTIFRQIEATEYVEDLFEIKSKYGTPNLSTFSALVNREMMWVVTEVVSEPSPHKRMRVIKQFIKIARQCKETQNFNSMFAIISGLGHGSVSRLKSTWEKVQGKYQRLFTEMQQLMDPSRNMSRYRNLVNSENVQPPIIPFYPVVKKDL